MGWIAAPVESPMTTRRFPEPRQCLFWREPERVREGLKKNFELVEEYADESPLRRYLLKCRECGQLYFFEFCEAIDWQKGNDPQYAKYVPVSTVKESAELASVAPFALRDVSPALCVDYVKEAERPAVYWAL